MKNGFTILELMLVIVILAIMASFGLTYYQQRTVTRKVDKTTLQIQQLLQAGRNFYSNNNAWPKVSPDPNFLSYIPVGNTIDPWGGTYIYQPASGNKKFQVIASGMTNAIAQQVAARLPSADVRCTVNICSVTAETAIPAQPISQQTNYLIKAVGESRLLSDQEYFYVPKFSCPENWSPQVVALLQTLYAKRSTDHELQCIPAITTALISQLSGQLDQCFPQPDKQNVCRIKLTAKYWHNWWIDCNRQNYSLDNWGQVILTYVAYCTPNTLSTPSTIKLL
jgi:prepilin-type N-terminal cleavage/methylation domain-containing protein